MTTPYRVSEPADFGLTVRTLPDDLVPERNGLVAWWSGAKRDDEWILPRAFRGFSFMGNLELDLTRARIGAGISEMELNCVMGSIKVTVPPDIRIVCDGDAVAGNFYVKRAGNTTPPPDAPTIHIRGTAYLGAVSIKIVDPNSPKWRKKLKALLNKGG